MITFKIRDLIIAVRPGAPTPEQVRQAPGVHLQCEPDGDRCDLIGCDLSCDLSCDPTGCDPTGCDPTGCNPSGCDLSCDPTGCDPTANVCGDGHPVTPTNCGEWASGVVAQMGADRLAVLKRQLRAAMQQIRLRESVVNTAAEHAADVPRTVEEVEKLENKLSETMDELHKRRAGLDQAKATTSRQKKKGRKR